MYKVLEPAGGYDLVLVARAWEGTEADRVYQPGLDRVTLAQGLIAAAAWGALAWFFAVIIVSLTILQQRLSERWVFYYGG